MLHEFVLGTKKELDKHAALMLKFPGMAHDEPYMARVPAGKTGEIVWTFNRAGSGQLARDSRGGGGATASIADSRCRRPQRR